MVKGIAILACFIMVMVAVTLLTTFLTWGKKGLKSSEKKIETPELPKELVRVTKQVSATFYGAMGALIIAVIITLISLIFSKLFILLCIIASLLTLAAAILIVLNMILMRKRIKLRKENNISQII